jgi:hypothetical protein
MAILSNNSAIQNCRAERLIVVLRQTLDWTKLAQGKSDHDTASFDRMVKRPVGTTAGLIDLWNRSFSTDFYSVRQKVKEVAAYASRQLRNATLLSLEQFTEPFDVNALYIFTDDDDWFAPEVSDRLLGSAAMADAIVWVSTVFERGTLFARSNSNGFCYTNNYALHGSFMARAPRTSWKSLPQMTQHGWAEGMVHGLHVDLVKLTDHLSITNKHPCSFTVLEAAQFSNTKIADLIRPYAKTVKAGESLFDSGLSDLAWARPYIEEISGFFIAGIQN